MTQHIPYHDMYSGPGESMGGEKAYVWNPKRDEDNIVTVMRRDYGPFESGWDMGSRPLDPQTVYSDSQERFQKIIDSTPKEANFNGIRIKEDHSVEEPLVWDREKTQYYDEHGRIDQKAWDSIFVGKVEPVDKAKCMEKAEEEARLDTMACFQDTESPEARRHYHRVKMEQYRFMTRPNGYMRRGKD